MSESQFIECICLNCARKTYDIETRVDNGYDFADYGAKGTEKEFHEQCKRENENLKDFITIIEYSRNEKEAKKHPFTREASEARMLSETQFNFGKVCEKKKYYNLSIFWYERALVENNFRFPSPSIDCLISLYKLCQLKKDYEKIWLYGRNFRMTGPPVSGTFNNKHKMDYFYMMAKLEKHFKNYGQAAHYFNEGRFWRLSDNGER